MSSRAVALLHDSMPIMHSLNSVSDHLAQVRRVLAVSPPRFFGSPGGDGWGQFPQRDQHKPPLAHALVGNGQLCGPNHDILVKQDVNVNRSRAFVDARPAAQRPFDRFHGLEEVAGASARFSLPRHNSGTTPAARSPPVRSCRRTRPAELTPAFAEFLHAPVDVGHAVAPVGTRARDRRALPRGVERSDGGISALERLERRGRPFIAADRGDTFPLAIVAAADAFAAPHSNSGCGQQRRAWGRFRCRYAGSLALRPTWCG